MNPYVFMIFAEEELHKIAEGDSAPYLAGGAAALGAVGAAGLGARHLRRRRAMPRVPKKALMVGAGGLAALGGGLLARRGLKGWRARRLERLKTQTQQRVDQRIEEASRPLPEDLDTLSSSAEDYKQRSLAYHGYIEGTRRSYNKEIPEGLSRNEITNEIAGGREELAWPVFGNVKLKGDVGQQNRAYDTLSDELERRTGVPMTSDSQMSSSRISESIDRWAKQEVRRRWDEALRR